MKAGNAVHKIPRRIYSKDSGARWDIGCMVTHKARLQHQYLCMRVVHCVDDWRQRRGLLQPYNGCQGLRGHRSLDKQQKIITAHPGTTR